MTEDPRVELENIEAELARRSLKRFVYAAWTILEPDVALVWNWHLDVLCGELESISRGELKRLIINVPPGTMKAMSVETPILTTWGWKRHGDVAPGDFVYAPDGQPRRVQAVTVHKEEPVCRVEFDERTVLIAGDGHEWDVLRDEGETPRVRRHVRVETPGIRTGARPDCIPVTAPISSPPRTLLIDPYVLGAWLGDGSTTSGHIYTSDLDLHNLQDWGNVKKMPRAPTHTQDFFRVLVPGLQTKLRVLGLLGNKHIPTDYLESSIEQRLSLLQGLMDTDGTCSKHGSCVFTNKNPALSEGVRALAVSLGLKPSTTSRMTNLNGKEYGPHYTVTFTACGLRVFQLERKQARVTAGTLRGKRRYVKSVEPCGQALVNCIQVEGGQYLVGKALVPTHNSLLVSVFWPAWEWASNPGLRILTASYGDRVAERDNVKMRDIILSPWYQRQYNVQLRMDQSAKQKFYTYAGGWRICTTTSGAGTGEHPDRLIIDDPHKADDAKSKIKLESVSDWYSRTISTRGASRGTAIILIMQRLAMADLSAFLEKAGGWKHLVFPMRYEPARGHYLDPRETKGELLWSELFPNEILKPIERLLGPYGTAGQMQQRPTPEGGGLFKRDWLPIITRAELPPREDMVLCRGWDTAGSEGEGDHTVGVLMGFHDENYYVLDVRRGQWGPMKVDRQMKEAARLDGKTCRIREEREPGSSGKAVCERRRIDLAGYDYDDVTVNKDKETRARPLRSQCEGGHVFLLEGSWNEPYIQEMIVFDRGLFDDQVDGSSVAFNELATVGEIALVDLVW